MNKNKIDSSYQIIYENEFVTLLQKTKTVENLKFLKEFLLPVNSFAFPLQVVDYIAVIALIFGFFPRDDIDFTHYLPIHLGCSFALKTIS